MKKQSGFEYQTYTQTPNSLFTLLPEMNECELKVLLIICRFTFGYHRHEVAISTKALARLTGMSETSVMLGAKIAVERGLIESIKDGKKTTVYKALISNIGDTLPQIMGIATPNFGEQLGVKESIKKEKKELSKIEKEQVIKSANIAVDKMLEMNKDAATYWKGRELIRSDLLGYADWYNGATNQVMTKRVQSSWWKALAAWKDEALSVDALQEAYTARSKWTIVSDPNQLTLDAVAINRTILAKPAPRIIQIYNPETEEEDYVPAPPRKQAPRS